MILFVYGTLKRKHRPVELIEILGRETVFICDAKVQGLLYISAEGFPALKDSLDSKNWVNGELLHVKSKHALALMDQYEGFDKRSNENQEYARKLIKAWNVSTGDLYAAEAYFYVNNCEEKLKIESGVF